MVLAEILCTCGHRFSVADDGTGAPHVCPQCRVNNVLPRVARRASSNGGGGETAVRATEVLAPPRSGRTGLGLTSSRELLPPDTPLGPYRIVSRIGRGGMGSVYEAIDDRMGSRVALKVLSPELAQQADFVKRFHREAKALSELSDRRIAKVYFSGAAEGLPFFAMEFIDGRNLEEILVAEGALDARRAVEWMREAARGLNSAADRGIIHRDVKPTNLLLDREGSLVIVDFGLAKAIDSESRLTMTGAVVGTPFYLSPEQGLGKGVDQRSDIYSLGATFYHLLTGKPPFDAEGAVSIIMRHINDAPRPLSQARPDLPVALARVIMRCLAKDPGRRYQDYEDLIADLDAVERGRPVSAPSEEVSIRRSQPSFVVVDELDDGSRLLRRASVVRRGFALLVDFGVLRFLYGAMQRLPIGLEPLVFFLPVSFLYLAIGDAAGGGTLGKRFLRLRVAKPDGLEPGPFRGMLRALALIPLWSLVLWFDHRDSVDPGLVAASIHELIRTLTGLSVSVAAIGLVVKGLAAAVVIDAATIVFTRRSQALHDVVSGTSVFREDPVPRKKKRPQRRPEAKPISPIVPLVLSFAPGLGQLVNGDFGKGLLSLIAIAFAMAVWGPFGILVWLGTAAEAFLFAARRRREWRPQD